MPRSTPGLTALALALATTLAACGGGGGKSAGTTGTGDSVRSETTAKPRPTTTHVTKPATTEAPATTVTPLRPEFHTESLTGRDAQLGYEYQVDYPQLAGLADPKVQDSVNAVLKAVGTDQVKEFVDALTKDPVSTIAGDQPSTLDVNPDTSLLSPDLASIVFDVSMYSSGAAHPAGFILTHTFDLHTGKELQLGDLFLPGSKFLDEIAAISRADLADQLGGPLDDVGIQGSAPDLQNYQSWLLSPTGLRIIFGEYQVGPYAIGTPSIDIPWAKLQDVVDTNGPLRTLLN